MTLPRRYEDTVSNYQSNTEPLSTIFARQISLAIRSRLPMSPEGNYLRSDRRLSPTLTP
jgi:hypothetical protein